jgi:hypothetical protein
MGEIIRFLFIIEGKRSLWFWRRRNSEKSGLLTKIRISPQPDPEGSEGRRKQSHPVPYVGSSLVRISI